MGIESGPNPVEQESSQEEKIQKNLEQIMSLSAMGEYVTLQKIAAEAWAKYEAGSGKDPVTPDIYPLLELAARMSIEAAFSSRFSKWDWVQERISLPDGRYEAELEKMQSEENVKQLIHKLFDGEMPVEYKNDFK